MDDKKVSGYDRKGVLKDKLPIVIICIGALMVLIGILVEIGVIC